mgnify:CR=1 FL=1
MPTLSFTSTGPLTANITIEGTTVREVEVRNLGEGLASVELAGVDVGARITGQLDVLQALVDDAATMLRGLR